MVHGGQVCPRCGEHADADPGRMPGFVFDRPDGDWLAGFETDGESLSYRERRLSKEEAAWLAR
jgi:hypothetical protein